MKIRLKCVLFGGSEAKIRYRFVTPTKDNACRTFETPARISSSALTNNCTMLRAQTSTEFSSALDDAPCDRFAVNKSCVRERVDVCVEKRQTDTYIVSDAP